MRAPSFIHPPDPAVDDADAWLDTFAQPFAAAIAAAARSGFIASLAETLRGPMRDANRRWRADHVRIRCRAIKP